MPWPMTKMRSIDKFVFVVCVLALFKSSRAETVNQEKLGWIIGLAVSAFVALAATVTLTVSACLLCSSRRSNEEKKKAAPSGEYTKPVREKEGKRRNYTELSGRGSALYESVDEGYDNSLATFKMNSKSDTRASGVSDNPDDYDYGGMHMHDNPNYVPSGDTRPSQTANNGQQPTYAFVRKFPSIIVEEDGAEGILSQNDPHYQSSSEEHQTRSSYENVTTSFNNTLYSKY